MNCQILLDSSFYFIIFVIMKINLDHYLQQELTVLTSLLKETKDWERIDTEAFEMKILTKDGEKNIIMVMYHELLSYTYVYRQGRGVYSNEKKEQVISEYHTIPWIACRIELEGDHNTNWHYDVLTELKKWVKENLPWKPFYDEDATAGIFSKKCSPYSRDWTKYVFYVNPDFPHGWWENHTL